MMEKTDIEIKYQKLATEYSKVSFQIFLVHRGVFNEVLISGEISSNCSQEGTS